MPQASAVAPSIRSHLRRSYGHPVTHLLLALLLFGLLQAFVVKPFFVPSGSMEHSLEIGDRLIVNRLAYAPKELSPSVGDVVVFHTDEDLWPSQQLLADNPPLSSMKFGVKRLFGDFLGIGPPTQNYLVKRVIGTPGQSIECCNSSGKIVNDGHPREEPYVFQDLVFMPGKLDCQTQPQSQRCFPLVKVPEGTLLLLGDHRSDSSDGMSLCRAIESPTGEGCARWVRTEDVLGKVHSVVWPLDRIGVVHD